MPEKMWGAEPFWGLSYDWDPDWVLTDRQKELRETLIGLCEQEMRANAKRSDDELLYPRRNLELMGEHGFLALTVPEEYGGLGENHVAFAMVCETIARYGCASTAMCYVMHMAAVQTIMLRPTPELIEKYIRAAQRRQARHAVLLRPRDRLALLVPVLLQAPSASNGGYKVNKKASWTTSGGFADFYVVQTTSPDFSGYDDLSVFVIDGERRQGPAVAVGRARPARQPVRPDPGRRRRDPGRPDRRPGGRRRGLQRRGRRPVVPDRLLVGLERHRARRDRHRQAPHDAQAPRRRRHARRRLPDDPGLRRRGRDGHERLPAVRLLRRAGDGQGHRRQHPRARAGRDGARRLPALGVADQVRGGQEHRPPRRQDAARLRRLAATSATWSSSATCATPRPAG